MADILMEPVSNEAAARALADKPAVLREAFGRLVPEIRARVFTVGLVEDANVLQEVRDAIAELPRGAAWAEVKGQVAEKLGPWMDADMAVRRAELLVRLHGFQSYAAAEHEAMQTPEARAAFPYLQYVATGDEATRDSHQALDGLILPADHEFWQTHYPPWEFGCRCQVVPVSGEEFEEAVAAKRVAGEAPALRAAERRKGWTIPKDSAIEKQLSSTGRLDFGDGHGADVRTPVQRADSAEKARSAYSWNPGDLRIPLASLREKYEPWVWSFFQQQADGTEVEFAGGRRRSVWDWALDADRERAAEEALEFGRRTNGRERSIFIDYSTGERFGHVDGTRGVVHVGPMLERARAEGRTVVGVHAHLSGEPPTPMDVALTLDWQGTLRESVIATADGPHVLKAGPRANRERDRPLVTEMIRRQGEMDSGAVSVGQWVQEMDDIARAGRITHEH